MFDFGATHSFIYINCTKRLKLLVSELNIELGISTPTEDIIKTSSMRVECTVVIDGQTSSMLGIYTD